MTLSAMITWVFWIEYSSLCKSVEKSLFFFTTSYTFLSVIEWACNGSAVAAHKETAMSITSLLSPLYKCMFMHGNTCTTQHVHRRQMCLFCVGVSAAWRCGQCFSAVRFNRPLGFALQAFISCIFMIKRNSPRFTVYMLKTSQLDLLYTLKECLVAFGSYNTGESSRRHYLLHTLF